MTDEMRAAGHMWRRHGKLLKVWRAKPLLEIQGRAIKHARRCSRGCSLGEDSMILELTCLVGAVLYDALDQP